jgi:hypothetical protein
MKIAIFGLIGSILMIVSLTSNALAGGLPDIIGIQLGMPLEQANELLLKNGDPKARLKVMTTDLPTIDKPVTSILVHAPPDEDEKPTGETTIVNMTLPPNKQVVWRVHRLHIFPDRGMPRDTLLATLREKYGEETDNYTPLKELPSDKPPTDLWWLFDEQGGRVERLPPLGRDMYVHHFCSLRELGSNAYFIQWFVKDGPSPLGAFDDPRIDMCDSSYIAAHARLVPSDMPELVKAMSVLIVNRPFASRAGTATKAWKKDIAERKYKQDIEKAKQHKKPKL